MLRKLHLIRLKKPHQINYTVMLLITLLAILGTTKWHIVYSSTSNKPNGWEVETYPDKLWPYTTTLLFSLGIPFDSINKEKIVKLISAISALYK